MKKSTKLAPQEDTEQETAEQEFETILGVQLPVYNYFFSREIIAFEKILLRVGKDQVTYFGRNLEFFDTLMESRGPKSRPPKTTLAALEERTWTVEEQKAFNAAIARLSKPFTEMLISRRRAEQLERISQLEPEVIAAAVVQHQEELAQLNTMLIEAQERSNSRKLVDAQMNPREEAEA